MSTMEELERQLHALENRVGAIEHISQSAGGVLASISDGITLAELVKIIRGLGERLKSVGKGG